MRQRVPRRAWDASARPGRRPRVLVEDANPALAISDFSAFQQAGFDVAWCSGAGTANGCPLLRGGECEVLAGADVVITGLHDGLAVAAAIRQRYPAKPVLVRRDRRQDGSMEKVPEGCRPLPADCSVHGQVEALRLAVGRR